MRHNAGKIVGLLLGFLLGLGPWGAVAGFILGHLYDTARADTRPRHLERKDDETLYPDGLKDGLQQSTFTVGVIVLGAKMAKADGRVSREEIAAFKRVFHIPPTQEKEVGRLFDRARQSAEGYEPYAARLAQVFRNNPAILEEILTGLFGIAASDGAGLSRIEANFLRRVALMFGFSEQDFQRIAARSGARLPEQPAAPKPEENAYMVLGLSPQATEAEIKKAYRTLIRKFHPDKLIAQGLPPEIIAQTTEKMKRINAAYDSLCRSRGIR